MNYFFFNEKIQTQLCSNFHCQFNSTQTPMLPYLCLEVQIQRNHIRAVPRPQWHHRRGDDRDLDNKERTSAWRGVAHGACVGQVAHRLFSPDLQQAGCIADGAVADIIAGWLTSNKNRSPRQQTLVKRRRRRRRDVDDAMRTKNMENGWEVPGSDASLN